MSHNADRNSPSDMLDILVDPDSDYNEENNEGEFYDASNLPIMTISANGTINPLDMLTVTLGETDTNQSPTDLRTICSTETINPMLSIPSTSANSGSDEATPLAQSFIVDFQPNQSVVGTSRSVRARPRRVLETGRLATSASSRGATRAVNGVIKWQRGQPILEVCLEDQDVPTSLREIVADIDNARRARQAQGTKGNRRNVRASAGSEIEDDYQDTDNYEAQKLFNEDLQATIFNWTCMASFKGCEEVFQPKNAGPAVPVTSAYEAFRIYWDDDILQHIVQETNRYAVELSSSSKSFARDWIDTNVHEILILFAFWMMIGVIKMPSIKSCFSTNPLLKTEIFRSLLTEARYWNLNRALHFVNNETQTPNSSKLFPLGPIVDHLNAKFQQAYNLHQNIVIDESLTLWKGNLFFKQYMKRKAVRFGIKTFELCESKTGYLWSFVIYTGKDYGSGDKSNRSLKITDLVVQLMKPLLNKGHKLFLDNWFNSPLLARYLKRNKTDCVGTLRNSRKNVPTLIKLATLSEGTCIARHSGDVVVMAYQDKKTVYTISTCHGTESVLMAEKPGRPLYFKPAVIADYNRSMGGVVRKEQMLEPYLLERKRNKKWYKKMFKRLLNVSIFNSRILVDQSSVGDVKQLAFRLELANSIINQHLPHVPRQRRHQVNQNLFFPLRFSGNQHFIVRSQVDGARTVGSSRSSAGRVGCLWCQLHKKTKRTVYKCKTCNVPLCLEGCFESFHTP